MSLNHSLSVVTNGLVFYYDMNNSKKSWKGAPTSNVIYADFDTTFESLAIGDTAGFSNQLGTGNVTGVSSNTSYSGVKSLLVNNGIGGTSRIYRTTPLNLGDYCVVSGWVYSKIAGAHFHLEYAGGNYTWNVAGNETFNTHTGSGWEFLYSKAGAITTSATTCYYFFYPGVNSVNTYVDQIQVEKQAFATSFVNGTRSNTQAILDLTNNNTVTATSLTYNSDGTFSFNGSVDYLTITSFVNKPTTAITVEAWLKPTKPILTGTIRGGAVSSTNSMYLGIIDSIDGGATHAMHWANQTSSSRIYNWNGNIPNNAWSHLVGTYDGSTTRAYLNGVEIWSAAQTGTIPDATYALGTYAPVGADGTHTFNGLLPTSRIYNRALSASEVKQNFNALRGRYGI